MEYSDEELNYFRLCKIATHIIPEGLREIFKQQWDIHYTSTHGAWTDTPTNYTSFYGMESPRNRTKNKRLLGMMTNGDRKNWDSTCLSYAILFSDSVGPKLHSNVKNSVDALRESRNDVAHNAAGTLNDVDFQASVQKVLIAFITLKLDTTELLELRNQTSFPTGEFNVIKKELDDEKKRNAEAKPFCVLPPKSFHDQIERKLEVQDISKKMKELSTRKKGEATTVYLSGNPGCGKSVLAGQIGSEYFDSADTLQPAFVMTINASNMDTLLQSYVDFAVKLNCYPDSITEITTSKDLSQEKQIQQLKALGAKEVDKYASWLMIIDNVLDLRTCCKCWTQFGEKTSGIGQILITTQDEHSVADNSYTWHISLKEGMTKEDSIEVLSTISGKTKDEGIILKVAESLDFQPLALACAGVYMKTARASTTWQQFLEKLAEGKREATEKEFEKYSVPMTAAVRMALKRESSESEVMRHAFEFLSVMANEPIPTEYVVEYVNNYLPEEDEDVVASTITSSSLVLTSEDEDRVTMHQIVYHCLQENPNPNPKEKSENLDMFTVISAFSDLLKSFDKNSVEDIIKTRALVNHFDVLSNHLPSYIVQQQSKCQTILNKHFESLINYLNTLGSVCIIHGKYHTAEVFFKVSLSMQLPSFINEMEQHPVADSDFSEFSHLNLLRQERLNCISMLVRSVYDCPDYKKSPISYQDSCYILVKKNLAKTMSSLGIAFSNLGQFSEAQDCHELALIICELEYEHTYNWLKLKAEIMNNLAEVSMEMGNMKHAKQYRQKSIIIHKEINKILKLSSESVNVGLDLNDCVYIKAGSYYGLGKSNYTLAKTDDICSDENLQDAIANLEKSLASYKLVYGEQHPKVANILNRLGRSVFRLRKYDQALHDHYEALSICKFVYGDDHPLVGSTLNNLGKTLLELHCYDEATANFKESLVINKRLRGDNHPTIGELQLNLAHSLSKQKHFNEAKTFCEKALDIFKREFRAKHHLVVQALVKLANIYNELGECAKMATSLEEAFSAGNINLMPRIAASYVKLGNTFRSQQRYLEAKGCYERSLETGYCSTPVLIGEFLANIGNIMAEKENFTEAASCYINALNAGYGKGNTKLGENIFRIGSVMHVSQLQLNTAKTCYIHALTTGYGKDSPSVGKTIFKLGATFFDQGKLQEAKTCYIHALTTGYGKDSPPVGQTIFELGTTFYDQRKADEAKTCYMDALSTGYGKDCPSVGQKIFKLGTTFFNHGKLYEAKTCYINALYTAYGKACPCVGEAVFQLGTLFFDQCKLNQVKTFSICDLSNGYGKQFGKAAMCNMEFLDDAANCYIEALSTGYGEDCPPLGKQIFDLGKEFYHFEKLLEAKACYIAALTTGYGNETPSVEEALVNLFESLCNLGKDSVPFVRQAILEIGKVLYNLVQFDDGRPFYINPLTAECGGNRPFVGEGFFKLGKFFFDQGKLQEAKTFYIYALSTGYGKDNPYVGETVFKLGTVFSDKSQFTEAKTCYVNAITTGYGKNCRSVGEVIFNLGNYLYNQTHFNEAQDCYVEALSTGYAKDCPSIGESVVRFGSLFYDLREINVAKVCYMNALVSGYGMRDCPAIRDSICKLVISLYDLGLLAEAKTCFESLENAKCNDDHSLGSAKFNLGKTRHDEGDYIEAKTAFEQCLATGYGGKHPEVFALLGDALYHLERYDEAEICYKTVLAAGYTSVDCPTLDTSFLKLGKAFYELGEYHKSLSYYRNVLGAGFNGEHCLPFCTSLFDLGATFCDLKQYREAKMCFEMCLRKAYRALTGKEDDFICLTLVKLLITLEHLECYEAAVPYYKELVAIAKIVFGRNNPLVSDLYILLGETLVKLGKIDEANRCFKEGKRILTLFGRVRRLLSSEQTNSTLTDIEKGVMMLKIRSSKVWPRRSTFYISLSV